MTEAHVITGAVVQRDGKVLMVQEAQEKCYGKWCLPYGHLEAGESIFDAAIREVREETGYEVKLTGLLVVKNYVLPEKVTLNITFNAEVIADHGDRLEDEILDVKWMTFDEIRALGDNLRMPIGITTVIAEAEAGKNYPLDIVKDIIRIGEK